MKEVYEVLKQKEIELARVANEVQALQVVAPLLLSDDEGDENEATSDASISRDNLSTFSKR